MPPVPQKQSPRPKPSPPPVTSSGQQSGIKLLAYGRSKTGKTRLLATFPKPLLIIGTEDGTKSIANGRREKAKLRTGTPVYELQVRGKPIGVDFVRLSTTQELDELVPMVRDGYASVGEDTAGGLQDLILKEVLGLDDVPVQKSWGMSDQRAWGVVGMQFKERNRTLLDLADRHGTNVMIVAHERNFSDEGSSELVAPTVGAALTPSAAGWLNGAVDYICQTFLRPQTTVKKEKVGNQVVDTETRTGKIEYCLRIGPHEVYMTGFRVTPGMGDLPDAIPDPSYDKIMRIINGE